MGDDMWRLWFTKLLLLVAFLLTVTDQTRSEDGVLSNNIRASRIERDLEGVTTVLLISARPGKSVPPVGLLTKTARTFVQDGASTEFATQVLGTTLDNGRLYARILSTSSRVFYDREPAPDPSSPYVVYPSRAPNDDWRIRVALDNAPIKAIEEIEVLNGDSNAESSEKRQETGNTSKLDEMSKENDIFNKRELNVDTQRFKPAKVRADNLPTYTVKHEYVSNNFDSLDDDAQSKTFRSRVPKIFKPQVKTPPQRKLDPKPFATVTYHGFADFTTTVGDTVIIFSPSTSPAPMGRPATTIKGDATLRPDDGVAVLKIRPTTVMEHARTDRPYEEDRKHGSDDQFLSAINRGNIQPSVTEEFDAESSKRSTEPLLLVPDVETGSLKPTGLLKVVDSTTSSDGTTTHYKSHIYGTYIGTNYAQIIHTSSNVYFFPDDATVTYGTDDTTVEYGTTETESDERDTTVEALPSTTPTTITTSEEEMNELTTPLKDTTDSVLTTLKDILESARRVLGTTESVLPTLDDEIPNDIVQEDPQGRSIKGGSSQNNLRPDGHKLHESGSVKEKETLATRLLPSTVYKTFTYFTTFFIPGDGDQTTTSIRSREVVSSEVTFLTELIQPTSTKNLIRPTTFLPSGTRQRTPSLPEIEEEQTTKQDEEIELIFKTLYTTYTYLTTFFQENTSSVSSRQVVETNVITQTVGQNGVSAVVASLFEKDESVLISPTTISQNILPSVTTNARTPEEFNKGTEPVYQVSDETTEGGLTTFQQQDTTVHENIPTESITTVDDFETSDGWTTDLEPSPTPAMASAAVKEQVKTYYTTYTYFTTIFVDDETEIETRTEVFTNVVTETITPTKVQSVSQETVRPTTPKSEPAGNKAAVPPEILAYLEALQHQKSQEEALSLAKKVQQANTDQVHTDETTESNTETTTEVPTTLEDQPITERLFRSFQVGAQVTPNPPTDVEVLGSMITDVVSSSSSGGGTVLDVDKRNIVPEDQELSESNNHEVEPAPTLLLQTSYTTFTYFTTMYKGDQTNVASRLETVTNVVTETLRPSLVVPVPTSTLPVTYFTTFTYWTTFYKGGDTITTSREETISNVVTSGVSPTPTVELGVIMTYTPTVNPPSEEESVNEESKVTADNEVTPFGSTGKSVTEDTNKQSPIITKPDDQSAVNTSSISPEPTTFYTTFTYFTTSYIGNETILNSRLETVTSVSIPDIATQQATGRAIGGPVYPPIQTINTDEKTVTPSKVTETLKTGLISTIRSSEVHEDTTTHYMTDVYGTSIDGYYARVVKSSTRVETPPLPSSSIATPVLPTGVLSLNKGSVIDADEVTTVYFTTKQIGTLFEGTYAKVIESTSSTKIDEERKASIPPTQGHRTGLVRLIQGQMENNGTTTFYQSKVIGTSIEGRYAQIIESTSSFFVPSSTANIAPTSTLPPSQSTGIPEISPSPAVIQSSLSEDHTTESSEQDEDSGQNEDDEEDDEEDDDGQSSKKKSRLTFSTRKRTFTPVIRPFASRNRPTFNPKRKGAQAATTITRTDITPTITATLAGKGNNRFTSSRRVTSPTGPYSPTLSPSGSRRFPSRRVPATSSSAFPAGNTRSRVPSRITPTSVFQGSRRSSTSVRGSSTRGSNRASSSAFPGTSSRYRGIRPSSTLLRGQPTVKHDDQENDANEFTTTTLVTDETPFTEYVDGETVTTPLQTTTESSRRSTNPLLKFRRPINLNSNGRSATTPKPTTTTPRRSGNLNRPSTPTVPRVTNGRTNTRATPPVSTRTRPSNTGLFPPRGLLGRKQEVATEEPTEPNEGQTEDSENFEEDPVEEISDNDYEGSEHEDRKSNVNVNRRSGKVAGPIVQIRPFGVRTRRVRRQASQLRAYSSRFRRPAQSSTAKAEDDSLDTIANQEDDIKIAKPPARYNNRARSLTSLQPQKTSNSPDQTAETTELSNQQSKPRTRLKQSNGNSNGNRNGSVRIKPSPASNNGRQFTLREKDASLNRSGYKRPTSGPRTNGRSTSKPENGRVRPPRRNGSSKSTESTNSRRVPSRSRSVNGRNGNNRRISTRGRGSYEDIREAPTVYPNFDGTITVTHYVPTEVTIPVVNNGVTEHRNIITAQPSTEVLGPSQYSTVTAGDGKSLVVIVSEVTGTNVQGQAEVTRFLLHETPTTRISHTLASLGGRRVSQSVIIPSTVYSVENIVSTIQPSLPGNAPLANILLSQLLLGQLGQPNPLLQPQATPTTQYNTRTTSYVTTITKHQSTIIPLTFRGKEILTTLVDTSTDVVTATEFITDTVVVTPTVAIPAANINSLLLLLQQPQTQPQNTNPLLDPLFAAAPFTQSNTLPGEVERRHQPADSDYRPDSYEYFEEDDAEDYQKPSRSRGRGKSNDKKKESKLSAATKAESSVVTLYVSGRRPGEFSTVLSTVKIDNSATASRRRRDASEGAVEVRPSVPPSLHAGPVAVAILAGSEDPINAHAPTQSLESVVGNLYAESVQYGSRNIEGKREGIVDTWSTSEDYINNGRIDDDDESFGGAPRKRVRIRVPVVRSRTARQHKFTVVRRRPLTSHTKDLADITSTTHAPRRIVVTRVRTLGSGDSVYPTDTPADYGSYQPTGFGKHKVTITRRRKLQSTPTSPTLAKNKVRVTRKKLVAVRPILPTSTFAVITTGFFTASSSEYDEYSDEEEEYESEIDRGKDHSVVTPSLEEMPNLIDNRPDKEASLVSLDASSAVSEEGTSNTPVIITDNFFLPSFDDEEDEEYEDEEYEDDDTTTTTENVNKITVLMEDEHPTISPKDEDNIVTNKNDVEMRAGNDNITITIPISKTKQSAKPSEEQTIKTSQKSDNASISITESITSKDINNTKSSTKTIVLNEDDDKLATKEQTTTIATLEEQTFIEDITTLNVSEESTSHPDEEKTTEKHTSSVTETITLDIENKGSTEVPEDSTERSVMSETISENPEEILTVQPIQSDVIIDSNSTQVSLIGTVPSDIAIAPSFESVIPLETTKSRIRDTDTSNYLDDSSIPSVIPLDANYTREIKSSSVTATSVLETVPATKVTSEIASPTPEEIEAGLADDLYLSLSRLDFPEILPTKSDLNDLETKSTPNLTLEPSTSVYYTETVVTSTRLRTYTYVVTQLNGLETKVTSSTTVRPRVTTLTLTVPVTVTVTPTVESSAGFVSSMYNPVPVAGEYEAKDEEEGRRFNLATRVMSNGVEVIVAGPTPALRWENSNPQPTLTLSEAVVMLLPQDKPNEFVTKTCTTTFTYLNTITKDGTTTVSTEQQVVANTATEERHRKPGSETAAVTLDMSPTLRTEVFKTTYTYLTLNTDHPDVNDALESSTKVITNTVTAPQHYLDMILEPSEAPRPETNTYLSTRVLEKTFMEEGRTKIGTVSDTITQLIVTESAPPPRPTSVTTTLTALDNTDDSVTDMTKTYYITYTYFNTFLEKGSTIVRTNVATSTDVVLEKVPVRKTTTKTAPVNPTPEPIQIFATKTYLTTFTYFTTLLQAGPDGETSTTVTSRSHIVENVVTESIAPSLLDAGYMNALLTTAHHSDPVKNVVTGSTIIFFDEEDQIDPTATSNLPQSTSITEIKKHEKGSTNTTNVISTETSEDTNSDIKPADSIDKQDNNGTTLSNDEPQNKRPNSQSGDDVSVSKPLLSLSSLGINSLSALGPVITAMAGLLQGKTAATRRNDSVALAEIQEVTTQRSPIYIPVAEFADGDIETAESQHIAAHLANLNHNYIAETRHKVTSSLADGIPISPGEVITANSDVIIGKPGKMAPRPPQTFLKDEQHIGMKPPPLPVPNIPVHPVLEVLENDDDDEQVRQTAQDAQVQILPAHQVYEEHLKVPVSISLNKNHPTAPKQSQKLLPVQSPSPPKRIASKQDILENDPLLKPPNRPNVEQYANPNINHKIPEWNPEKYRRPWSAKDPLTPPARLDEIHPDKPIEKSHPTSVILSSEGQKRPPWAQKDPLLPDSSIVIQDSEPKLIPTEPIVHQVPHVIDRSTGQPLLVNIQPSQVANVVIPQGGTQALIFGDTNEPHISGQYFDDPSPYPEPEVGPGFVGIQKVKDLPQYSSEKNPALYMVPPSPSTNFKSSSPKPSFSSRPHAILLSPIRGRPQEVSETPVSRPDKRPSEIHLIKRPDGSGSSSQGHVHTEILVHHKPETINIRPQPAAHPSANSHPHSVHQAPVRGHFSNGQTSMEQAPPRRVEVTPTEVPHRYIFPGKPDSGNEITLATNWKSDKKPIRFALNNRSRPRPRPTTNRPLDRHVFVERPTGYPPIRKPMYSGPQRPPTKTHNTFVLPHRPPMSPQSHQEPTRIPPNLFTLQIDNQNRPYPDKNVGNVAPPNSSTEQNDHVPTGAIEYHNPLHPNPVEENKHSQASGTNTQHLSLGQHLEKWQTNTEQTLDSDISASEYVNYQNQYHRKGNRSQETDNQNKKNTIDSQSINQTLKSQTLYGPVVSVNTVVGKPLEVEQEHDETYERETEKPLLQGPYRTDPYNTRPYELPIIQGKPFGVYNGYVDPATPYGYKRKEGNKPDYEIVHGIPAYNKDTKPAMTKKTQSGQVTTLNSLEQDDTIDLKPPAIIPQFGIEVDRPGRPFSRPIRPDSRPSLTRIKPEILTKPPIKLEIRPDYAVKRPENVKPNTAEIFANQTLNHGIKVNHNLQNWNIDVAVPDIIKSQQKILTGHDFRISETKIAENKNGTSRPNIGNKRPSIVRPEHGTFTRIHPEYPHILTKPKPQVPEPVIVSSDTAGLETHSRPNKFSMSVEATGEEVNSKTQTERPPSMLVTKNNLSHNKNDETLDTAYQTNFASSDSQGEQGDRIKETNVPSRDMMPPFLNVGVGSNQSKKKDQEGLKPPPPPSSDVLGLSPPPVDITTTHMPVDDRFALMTTDESGLKPPKYVPLKESTIVPPSTNMVPPSPRPSLTRPFLVELLSQDMVPPPPVLTSTRPLEIATVRPAVAVSGSIQIATAVATSHIPVIQDIESKIPIIHGTVDLPVVVDVPEILRPVETRMTEHVSIYTVRPFDTRPVSRIAIQSTSTLSTNVIIPTKLRPPQVDQIQPSRSSIHRDVNPTRLYVSDIPPNPVKRPEHPVFLESSHENILPSTRVEPTESLTFIVGTEKKQHSMISNVKVQKPQVTENSFVNKTANKESPMIVTRVDSSITKVTSTLIPMSSNKTHSEASNSQFTKNIIKATSTVTKDQSNITIRTKPKEVTRFKTSTVTRTKTSVLGSPPTTRTLLLTHTMTTTTVETVTETLLRPTNVVSTVTSTILQPIVTRVPSTYDNIADNDSIFVVMSDQKPPAPGAEEVEAEYGEEVSRDEQDPTGNEIHKVLSGGVLGAPIAPLTPVTSQCTPECKASKSEICAEVGTEMRCVCRPGFARMFLDRPCKPTYTYTLRVGLDRIGHEFVAYDAALNDSTSATYKRLVIPTKDALDRTLMQSDLRDVYRGLKIAGFIPDPTKVEFHVQLSDNANETRLKEILRKYLVGSNYSLGGTEVYASKNLDSIEAVDFDECASKEGGPHHDCSPHAACFNLRGSYQCSCREGWADLSENPAYPGRVCSQAPLGCAGCNNKGHCVTNSLGQEICECFPWHSGQRCQVNLKVLLIALVTTGAILLGLLAICVGMTCFRHPGRDRKTGDRRAMIPGTGGDTSSEGSVTDLAIPHHVPHVLPPPPQMIAPLPPNKRPIRKISAKPRHPPRKATMVPATAIPINDEQRDRSLTVMIPRAKYRSAPQSPQNYNKTVMSTFAAEEHKLINYLDNGTSSPANRKQSISSTKDCKEADLQGARNPMTPTGALVSAGFQVSATVTRNVDAESTLARSCGETTVEPATKVLRSGDLQVDLDSTLARSCGETTIQAPTKLLRLDLGEAGSTLARSCGETTIQPPTKVATARRNSVKDTRDNRDTRDSASEGHTMAERDLGSTLRLPAQHPPLYSPDRTSDRESNFDSL